MKENENNASLDAHIKTIVEMIEQIKYGSLTIIIQDGKIIQIDKIEKCRMKN